MDCIKISAVSYINTKPFIYGITNYKALTDYSLSLDTPSVCAQKLLDGDVDVGLVPIAILPQLNDYHILTDYCLGANGAVNSVMLYSEVPLNAIDTIYLDYQSRTSVQLTRILAANYWHITPQWLPAQEGFETKMRAATAGVVIGDRTFKLNGRYKYTYDLAAEWYAYTGLPFVFACWVANKKLPDSFVTAFNLALKYGVDHIAELLKQPFDPSIPITVIENYLTKNIRYEYGKAQQTALKTFLQLMQLKSV